MECELQAEKTIIKIYTLLGKKGFDINHKFDLKDYDGFPVDSLFSIAINHKPYALPNLAQVLIKAGANVQNEKRYLHACALTRSPDMLKALIEAGISDSQMKITVEIPL